MPGFVRSQEGATGWGLPLETSALVLEGPGTRVVLCGVDTLCIQAPAADILRARVADAVETTPECVSLELESHSPSASVLARVPGAKRLARGGRRRTDRRV